MSAKPFYTEAELLDGPLSGNLAPYVFCSAAYCTRTFRHIEFPSPFQHVEENVLFTCPDHVNTNTVRDTPDGVLHISWEVQDISLDDLPKYVYLRWLRAQIGDDTPRKCIEGETVYYASGTHALLPGHIYSQLGIAEFRISRLCEYHYDALSIEGYL